MRLSFVIVAGLLFAGTAKAAPDDLETSFQALKEAVPKKDPAEVKKLAAETCALARAAAATPAPTDPAEKDAWALRVNHAREVEVFTEYALYSTALAASPDVMIELLTTLEQQNAKSKYMDLGYSAWFGALTQKGEAAKIPELARRVLKSFPDHEDALIILADSDMNRQQLAAAGTEAERLIIVLNRHSKPEDMSAADWERKKTQALARAYWIAGVVHGSKNEHFLCDQDLRKALPMIQGNQAMLGPAYFYLGVSNYHIARQSMDKARMLEAAKFSDQAAAIRGPYQQQAWTNAHLMRQEADKMFARK